MQDEANSPEALRAARMRAAIEKADRAATEAAAQRMRELEKAGDVTDELADLPADAEIHRTDDDASAGSDARRERPSRSSGGGLGRRLSGFFGLKRDSSGAIADMPRPDRDGRVLTLHPSEETGSTIDVDKYLAMREAILAALPYEDQGVELKDLPDLVRPRLSDDAFPRHVSITWYCLRVKWDLEARGLVESVAGVTPERVRRTSDGNVRKNA